ncbi:ORF_8 [Catopsilia pomona nucleopolyhedrovirus]|uniref:ORF_8 n=1 Tax=Catopsilia pomona nucleopolyhedrovirus TaxID=1850906 RepID=A0A172WZ82_9ABAC|nr:ORF_8 [Catopsilia pomona nucleopolyhedrovirus]ANF29656.1 ORF_8 [Catopsilia pomona nucleopolyhedrovirus]
MTTTTIKIVFYLFSMLLIIFLLINLINKHNITIDDDDGNDANDNEQNETDDDEIEEEEEEEKEEINLEFTCVGKLPGVYAHPDPTICTKYFMCINDVAFELNCSANFEFDQTVQNCVPISDNGCTANNLKHL